MAHVWAQRTAQPVPWHNCAISIRYLAEDEAVPNGALRRPVSARKPRYMSALAAIEQNSTQTHAVPSKPRKISKRVRYAIELLVRGDCKTQKDAAERAKLSRERLCKALKEVHIASYLEQQTRVALAQSQAPAAATLIRLATAASSEHVQKEAAIHLLSMAGHKPKADAQVSVNVEIKAGYVIDLTGEAKPPAVIDVARD
jgi:hypothetical protein